MVDRAKYSIGPRADFRNCNEINKQRERSTEHYSVRAGGQDIEPNKEKWLKP